MFLVGVNVAIGAEFFAMQACLPLRALQHSSSSVYGSECFLNLCRYAVFCFWVLMFRSGVT